MNNIRDIYPLTPMQEGMYYHTISGKSNDEYIVQFFLSLKGKVDFLLVEKSVNHIVNKYDALKTVYMHKNLDQPVQIVLKERSIKLDFVDVSEYDENDKKSYVEEYKIKDRQLGFDLSKGITMRVSLLKLTVDTFILIWTFHHIIMDGWSVTVIADEFFSCYKVLSCNGHIDLANAVPYRDYIKWLKLRDKENALSYWKEYLEGYSANVYPVGIPEMDTISEYNREEFSFCFDELLTNRIISFCNINRITIGSFLQAVWSVMLRYYNGTDDVAFGSVISGRPPEVNGIESMVGLFINTIPLRIKCEGTHQFLELAKDIQNIALRSNQYSYFPLYEVNKIAKVKRKVVNHIINFTNYPIKEYKYIDEDLDKSITISSVDVFEQISFNFNIMVELKNNLKFRIIFNSYAYKVKVVQKLEGHFNKIIRTILKNKDITIDKLRFMTDEEKRCIIDKDMKNGADIHKCLLNVAVTATYTAEPLQEYITWWCRQFGILTSIKFAPYNQVFQQLLDENSLISLNDGLNLIMVRFEDWMRNDNGSDDVFCERIEKIYGQLISILKTRHGKGTYFIGVFPVSTHLNLSSALKEYIRRMNDRFLDDLRLLDGIYVLNFADLVGIYSLEAVFDSVKDKAGHIPFTDEFYAAAGTFIARKINSYVQQNFKVIVVDCDNTIWNGICGEIGPLGVSIDEPYKLLQKFLIDRYSEGMLLAICSKNNEDDVWEVFEKNPDMLLKKEHFSAFRINWNTKSQNIYDIANELNLDASSFIFLDDSKFECREVMTNCPQVLTLCLPEDHYEFDLFLKHVWAFDRLKVIEEDRNRSLMYVAERKRQAANSSALSLDDFLRELGLRVSMCSIKDEQIARAAQLTQRTNQFNLSTIRRTEAEIVAFISEAFTKCWVIEVGDRFGEYGIVGLMMAKRNNNELYIDTLLLSCRVLGRCVEEQIIIGLKRYCTENGISTIKARYVKTEKNSPARNFMDNTGWSILETGSDYIIYEINVWNIRAKDVGIEFYCERPYIKGKTEIPISKESGEKIGLCVPKEGSNEHGFQSKFENQGCECSHSNSRRELNVYVENEEYLVHRNYLLPLKNSTVEKIMNLPVYELVANFVTDKEIVLPRNQIEKQLHDIWKKVLSVDKLGINHNFFEVGGHSLLAVRLEAELEKNGFEFDDFDINNYKTVEEMALFLQNIS